jgi:hypothetical protein
MFQTLKEKLYLFAVPLILGYQHSGVTPQNHGVNGRLLVDKKLKIALLKVEDILSVFF